MLREVPVDASFVEECLPALNALETHGIEYLVLSARVVRGGVRRCEAVLPRFYELQSPGPAYMEVAEAYGDLTDLVIRSLDKAAEPFLGDSDNSASGIVAEVHFDRCSEGCGWEARCFVAAMSEVAVGITFC